MSGQGYKLFPVLLQKPVPFSNEHVDSPTQPAAILLKDAIVEAMLMVLSCRKDFWCACKPKTIIARELVPHKSSPSVMTITSSVTWNLMPK